MSPRAIVPALVAAACAACAGPAPGELMVVVETDMAMPKDIDAIRVEVISGGAALFDETYGHLGAAGGLRLPSTLGIVEGSRPGAAVTIRATALRGGEARVLREAVTTVPGDRIATLRVPLGWLCDGVVSPGEAPGSFVTGCGEGMTCEAGGCVPAAIDADALPDHADARVFGGGTGSGDGSCFDVAACLGRAAPAEVDLATCSLAAGGDINVALALETDGVCGPRGCSVALDAGSPRGWTSPAPGVVKLPAAVCSRIAEGAALGVQIAPTSAGCPQKTEALPTCGAWSSAGPAIPDPGASAPVTLAAGQRGPVDLAAAGGRVYWTLGVPGQEGGEVRAIDAAGGARATLSAAPSSARGLALDGAYLYWTARGMGPAGGRVERLDLESPAAAPELIASGLRAPEGIAVQGTDVFFTDFLEGAVYRVSGGAAPVPVAIGQRTPYRIVAHGDWVYWTDEGTGGQADGAVRMAPRGGGQTLAVAEGVATPRHLALDLDAGGRAAALFFTAFAYEGSVMVVPLEDGVPAGPARAVAAGQRYPSGLTLDADHVYWTNRGDGRVLRLPRAAQGGEAPEELAGGERAPGAIAVDGDSVLWIEEGTSGAADGAVKRRVKP